jgi:hypothetical protein
MPGLDSDPGIPHHCRKGGHVFGIRGHPREGMCSQSMPCLVSMGADGLQCSKSKKGVARRPYPTPTWAKRPYRKPSQHSRTGGSTMRTTTETSVTPKFRYAQIIESRPSRQPRDMMNRSGSRRRKHSRPLAPLRVCCFSIRSGVRIANSNFLRHLHGGRAYPLCTVVPPEVFRDPACVHRAARCCHATVFDNNGCPRW